MIDIGKAHVKILLERPLENFVCRGKLLPGKIPFPQNGMGNKLRKLTGLETKHHEYEIE
jgi:hypothetical protein